MDALFEDLSGVVLGSSVLVFVELIPILRDTNKPSNVALSSAFVKLKLQELSLTHQSSRSDQDNTSSSLRIQWLNPPLSESSETIAALGGVSNNDGRRQQSNSNRLMRGFLCLQESTKSGSEANMKNLAGKDLSEYPTIEFPSENPCSATGIPCVVIGYSFVQNSIHPGNPQISNAAITPGTLVRILPAMLSGGGSICPLNLDELCGEAEACGLTQEMEEEIIYNHNSETIRELHLRMALQLSHPIAIGTTEDALWLRQRTQRRRNMLANAVRRRCCQNMSFVDNNQHRVPDRLKDNQGHTPSLPGSSLPSIMRDGALLVHCPNHGTPKLALVKYIAKKLLYCDSVHVLESGSLLAKYGSYADAGLESTMHAITMSASVKYHSSICIILDHFDTFMPATISGRSSTGDAAAPVFKAIASYLKALVLSLKHRREFPFPSKNQLYDYGGKGGHVLPVRICIVAIVTCPDNGWRSPQAIGHNTCIFDALPIGTYRLPALSVDTRLRAFRWAFAQEGVALSQNAKDRLYALAVSATWSGGNRHKYVARMLRQRLDKSQKTLASIQDLETVFGSVGRTTSGFSSIAIEDSSVAGEAGDTSDKMEDPFHFIGGSADAKASLRDALTLDDSKRVLLESMGIDPPIGILFFGPPGCGKTLMAKGVARLLGASGAGKASRGGAFISLNSSEIAQAEIGSSEKIIAAAFKSAQENAPSVLFIDEFQALFVERSKSGSGKLTSTLLQCMDDIKQWRRASKSSAGKPGQASTNDNDKNVSANNRADVVVLAATNTPWMIDKAFLRPGRFDRIVHVGLPSQTEREAILKVHMSKMRLSGSQALCTKLSEKTNGFSGAELSALCRAAAVRCLLENSECVEERHFLQELEEAKGRSNTDLVERNKHWKP